MNAPAFTVAGAGVTGAGWRWVVLRRAGGRVVRVNFPPTVDNLWAMLAGAGHALQSLPERPPPGAV